MTVTYISISNQNKHLLQDLNPIFGIDLDNGDIVAKIYSEIPENILENISVLGNDPEEVRNIIETLRQQKNLLDNSILSS